MIITPAWRSMKCSGFIWNPRSRESEEPTSTTNAINATTAAL